MTSTVEMPDSEWGKFVEKGRGLVARGKVEPSWSALARALGVKRSRLSINFERLGVTRELLAQPDRWPTVAAGPGPDNEEVIDGVAVKAVLKALKGGPLNLEALANKLDRGQITTRTVIDKMIARGYNLVAGEETVTVPAYIPADRLPVLSDKGARKVRFGLYSDPHIGSKAAQVSALKAFLDLAVHKHGCEHLLCAGDMTAGHGVYRGQSNEVYAHGATEQLDALVNTIPQYPGVTHYILGGNHDASHLKSGGFDLVRQACAMREDWVFAGYDEATVPLTKDIDAMLWHPSGGVPYALTYRGQKYAAEVSHKELFQIITGKKDKPRTRLIVWGHLHVAASFPHGPIRVVGPGCFEGSTPYLKQKGLTPTIQGVVIEADITSDGMLSRFVAHEYLYNEQEDDWHCGWVPALARKAEPRMVPLFSLDESEA